jgi:hypothetical protein
VFDTRRSCAAHDRGKRKGQDDCEKNDREMRQTIRLKRMLHCKIDNGMDIALRCPWTAQRAVST